MVVSEIGEQWSPKTEPARVAARAITINEGSALQMSMTMGMRIPKVPQAVPMEKERKQATAKTMAGSSWRGKWELSMMPET